MAPALWPYGTWIIQPGMWIPKEHATCLIKRMRSAWKTKPASRHAVLANLAVIMFLLSNRYVTYVTRQANKRRTRARARCISCQEEPLKFHFPLWLITMNSKIEGTLTFRINVVIVLARYMRSPILPPRYNQRANETHWQTTLAG